MRQATTEIPNRCQHCDLRGAVLCRALCNAAVPGLKPATPRRFEQNDVIAQAGDASPIFGVLRRGYLRREIVQANGRRILLGILCPGDVVGGRDREALPFTLDAATEAEICTFDRPTVALAMENSSRFRKHLAAEAKRQHDALLEMIWRRGALTSRERILAFLVHATEIMPCRKQPDGSLILEIDLPRRDWADLTDTAVETISRTMTGLAATGLVTGVARNRYRIADLDQLAYLAGIDPPEAAPDAVHSVCRAIA
jgi:CRP-like cAMP-binding protein